MSDAHDHPAYPEEQAHLAGTVETMDHEIATREHPSEATPVYRNGCLPFIDQQQKRLEELRQHRPSPYFAHVDFQRADDMQSSNSPTPIYVGYLALSDPDTREHLVYHWSTPIADLFYHRQFVDATYQPPRGPKVCGIVSLIRELKIEDGRLQRIIDERMASVEPEIAERSPSSPTVDTGEILGERLRDVLGHHRDLRMRDIVPTIQAEQHTLIKAPLTGVLMIQGVAGSGKSSVALHRVAYLLHEQREALQENRIIVIGPNPVFLQSIAGVLPGLNVRQVQHTTFVRWAEQLLGLKLTLHDVTESIDSIADPVGADLARFSVQQLSHLKGSMRMQRLVEAYLQKLERQHVDEAQALRIEYILPHDDINHTFGYAAAGEMAVIEVGADEVRAAAFAAMRRTAAHGMPLNERRAICVDRLMGMVLSRFEHSPKYRARSGYSPNSFRVTRQRAFLASTRKQVVRQVHDWWPLHAPAECYERLLNSRTYLEAANLALDSDSALSSSECALLLNVHTHKRKHSWTSDDIAVLCYLHQRLIDQSMPTYDHMVIDEAQDLSPLQLWLLRQNVRNDSMTLVGDISQGINHFAIHAWEDLNEALDGVHIQHSPLTVSYRSTYEITVFANAILERLQAYGLLSKPARPVERHGPQPRMVPCATPADLIRAIIAKVTAARKSGAQSIAILCKTAAACHKLAAELDLAAHGITLMFTDKDELQGDAVMLPITLAKGLEFDTVIIAEADEDTYQDSEHDAKLLYVAATRALHELHFLWNGKRSPLLPNPNTRRSKAVKTAQAAPKDSEAGKRLASQPHLVPAVSARS